jgi:hypothetical protein
MAIYGTIRLTPEEEIVLDSSDAVAGCDLRREIDARAGDLLRAGDTLSASVYHSAGYVVWHYDLSDLRANGGTL